MSESARSEGQEKSSSSWLLVAVFWAYVSIPLAWGVYQTLTSVVALFTN